MVVGGVPVIVGGVFVCSGAVGTPAVCCVLTALQAVSANPVVATARTIDARRTFHCRFHMPFFSRLKTARARGFLERRRATFTDSTARETDEWRPRRKVPAGSLAVVGLIAAGPKVCWPPHGGFAL
jgi:hypothetical protein